MLPRTTSIWQRDSQPNASGKPGAVHIAGDDDVKVFIVVDMEPTIDFGDLIVFLLERMPHFVVPRYFERIDALPRTATHRVLKHELRARGNGAATWDARAVGYHVTRRGLGGG